MRVDIFDEFGIVATMAWWPERAGYRTYTFDTPTTDDKVRTTWQESIMDLAQIIERDLDLEDVSLAAVIDDVEIFSSHDVVIVLGQILENLIKRNYETNTR